MKRFLLTCILLVVAAWARPSLEFDRDRINAGSKFELRLVVPSRELSEPRKVPELSMRDGFTLLGIDSVDARGNDFFAGPYKVRKYVFKIQAPKKTGMFYVGPLTWNIDGENYTLAPTIGVELVKSYDDDAVAVSLTPSKKTVYEGEQFNVSLGFHTYEHFEGNLQALDMSTGNDFIVHRSDLANMEFKPIPNTRREMQASAKFAWLAPTKSGTLKIPPFKFKYTKRGEPKIVEENKQMGPMSFSSRTVKQESIEAETSTPTINITVKPLPTEGQPSDFSGMVGDYKFNAEFDKDSLKVGEALTLSIKISGDGVPGTIAEPKYPDFSDFRSVPPENTIAKKVTNGKVITTKTIKIFLYPKKKGEFTIPEMSYSWFNPTSKKYETKKAGPWNIIVEKGENGSESVFQNMNQGSGPVVVQKQEIESLGNDIRFLHNVQGASNGSPHRSILYWAILLLAIPFYFLVSLVLRAHRKYNSDAAMVRKGKASKLLKEKFENARNALKKNDGKAFYAALENGLIAYISNLTNKEFNGMTRTQMKDTLKELGIAEKTIMDIDSWLEKCAFVRFAPVTTSNAEQEQMLKDVEKLCESLSTLK